MYKCNAMVCTCNHFCCRKVLSTKYYERLCSLSYPARKSACDVLYCHLWPVWLYHIFPHYLINDKIFGGKKFLKYNVCFDFLYNFGLKHVSF
jgi:hypothetical protein